MIRHIVLFRLHAGLCWDDQDVRAAERLARQVGENVPDLIEWQVGRNVSDRDVAYDFAAIGLVSDDAALERYLHHPFHQRAVARWREISTWVVADLLEEGLEEGQARR